MAFYQSLHLLRLHSCFLRPTSNSRECMIWRKMFTAHPLMARYVRFCVLATAVYSLLWVVHIWKFPEKNGHRDDRATSGEMDVLQIGDLNHLQNQSNGLVNKTLPATTQYKSPQYKSPQQVPEFLPNYRNPCWYVDAADYRFNLSNAMCPKCKDYFVRAQAQLGNERRLLRCLPYFFLIGPQKCGTTDLWDKLLYHPSVVGGLMKEPHYWAWKQPHGAPLDQYADLYHYAALHMERGREGEKDYHPLVTGDASATTIWNNWEWFNTHPGDKSLPPHRVHSVIPQAKILLILRDPIKRLVSDFLYFGNDRRTPKQRAEFESKVLQGITWLDDCFSRHNRTHCMYSPVLGGSSYGWHWTPQVRLRLGLYVEFLEDWIAVFSRDQVHVELLEDYSKDKLPVLNRIFTFLGVGELPTDQVERLELVKSVKNAVADKKYAGFGEVSEEVMDRLHRFYDPYSHRLSLLLHRHLPWNCVYAEC